MLIVNFILEIETKFWFNKKSLEFKQNANSSMGSNGTISNSTQMNTTSMTTTMETTPTTMASTMSTTMASTMSSTMASMMSTTMASMMSTTMNITTQNDNQTDCSSMPTTSSTTMAWVNLDGWACLKLVVLTQWL